MAFEVLVLPVGALEANCYVLHDASGEALVIDPGGDADLIAARCAQLRPRAILLTHGHVDHIAGACALKERLGVPVMAHAADQADIEHPHPFFAQMVGGVTACQVDEPLAEGQVVTAREVQLTVLHTPGHSRGSVCLAGGGMAFTGDTLFAGSVGRTDLPGGDWETLLQSLRRLFEALPGETAVYPGHGPASTLDQERATNPFLEEL